MGIAHFKNLQVERAREQKQKKRGAEREAETAGVGGCGERERMGQA